MRLFFLLDLSGIVPSLTRDFDVTELGGDGFCGIGGDGTAESGALGSIGLKGGPPDDGGVASAPRGIGLGDVGSDLPD